MGFRVLGFRGVGSGLDAQEIKTVCLFTNPVAPNSPK